MPFLDHCPRLPFYLNFICYQVLHFSGTCTIDEFECPKNHRCIKGSVKCNNYNPCGDETDCGGYSHTHHSKSQSGQTTGSTRSGLDVATVIGIVVSVGFLIILLVLVVAVIKTRRFQPRPRVSIV